MLFSVPLNVFCVSELISRLRTKNILDRVAENNPKVIDDLVPNVLPLDTVQTIFKSLLRKPVSIRDSATIFGGALSEAAMIGQAPARFLLPRIVEVTLPNLSLLSTASSRRGKGGAHRCNSRISPFNTGVGDRRILGVKA